MKNAEFKSSILPTIVAYLLWFVTVALCVLDLLRLRSIMLAAYVALRLGKWTFGVVDKAGTVVIGFACLIFVLVAENWYRKLAEAGWKPLFTRFAIVTVGQVAIILIASWVT